MPLDPRHAVVGEADRDPAAPAGEAAAAVEQSREDTDAAWGEYPASDDERLRRDRPPHWDDF